MKYILFHIVYSYLIGYILYCFLDFNLCSLTYGLRYVYFFSSLFLLFRYFSPRHCKMRKKKKSGKVLLYSTLCSPRQLLRLSFFGDKKEKGKEPCFAFVFICSLLSFLSLSSFVLCFEFSFLCVLLMAEKLQAEKGENKGVFRFECCPISPLPTQPRGQRIARS